MRKRSSESRKTEDGATRGRLPPLSMVRAFEAVSRLGSMRRAAEDLNLSHTVVSRHVRNLEAWLSTRLVEAGPRGVRLTNEGRMFGNAIGQAFDLIAASTAELRPARMRSQLRIWCVPGLATRWLTPRFAELQRAMPGLDFVIRAIEVEPDFNRYEADVSISFGDEPRGPAQSTLLCRPRMFPVASPAWVEANAPVTTLADLRRQPLIHEESRDQWRQWFLTAQDGAAANLSGPRMGSASLALDAAVAGQGIALANHLIAADDIRAGRLVELLATDIHLGGYYFAAPRGRWGEPVLARFRAWLEQEIRLAMGGTGASATPRSTG